MEVKGTEGRGAECGVQSTEYGVQRTEVKGTGG